LLLNPSGRGKWHSGRIIQRKIWVQNSKEGNISKTGFFYRLVVPTMTGKSKANQSLTVVYDKYILK
jgi:hypothetical protein